MCNQLVNTFNNCIIRPRGSRIHCKENKSKIECDKRRNYLFLVVVTDDNFGGICNGNRLNEQCSSPIDGKKSDILLYCRNQNTNQDQCIFIEFKSGSPEEAIDQLENTIKWFKITFPNWNFKTGAVVVYHGSAPKQFKDKQKKLNGLLDKKLFLKSSPANITDYVYENF